MKTDKTEDARGRRSWRSSFLGDPGAQCFCANGGWQQNKDTRPVAAAKRAYNARSGGRLLTTEHP
jgi:hypothetical protein